MVIENHSVDIDNRVFCCDVDVTPKGCRISNLVEVLEDATELPVISYYYNRVLTTINEDFRAEIEQEIEDDPFNRFCEQADEFRRE
jgi:hypothetical protein